MSDITGNKNITDDLTRVLFAVRDNAMRNTNVADIAKVTIVDNYLTCVDINNAETIICTKLQGLDIMVNDTVLIVYTNTDFRENLSRIKQNIQVQTIKDCTLHSKNYGVIIGVIYRQGE